MSDAASASGRPARRAAVGEQWTVADLVDLEVLAYEDAETEPARVPVLEARDRALFDQYAAALPPGQPVTRRAAFRSWLEARRRDRYPRIPSPGQEIASLFRWVAAVLFIFGLLFARGAVWSFFRGAELGGFHPEPINVRWFWLVCIGLPLVFSIYGFWVLLGQKAVPKLPAGPAFLRGAIFALLRPLLARLARQTTEHLGAERRLQAQTLIGAVRQRMDSRRSALGLAGLKLAQAFGIAFTAGVLLFSWIDTTFYSRIFGWQTTDERITAASVHGLVRQIAAPWGWYHGDGVGYPTVEQVAQTKFLRNRTINDFPAEAASAWASFLLWCAFVYGLLPRLLLAWSSRWQLHRALAREEFNELRFDGLWERMTLRPEPLAPFSAPVPDQIPRLTPKVPPAAVSNASVSQTQVLEQAGAAPERSAALPTLEPAVAPPRAQTASPTLPTAAPYLLILRPDLPEATGRAAEQWMREHKGWGTATLRPLKGGLADKQALLAVLAGAAAAGQARDLLLVHESYVPAVKQFTTFLTALRQAGGPRMKILIGLVGLPDETSALGQPPKAIEAEVWQKKIVAEVADANIGVLTFLPPV